jgi:hypothetical protein
MKSDVKIVSQCPDTLVLNCYPTDSNYQIERHEMSMSLRGELEQLKKFAQDKEEPIASRFLYPLETGSNLMMQAKGGDGFNWILKNDYITVAVNRSSKMLLWAQVRCSSQYLQSKRDIGKVVNDVHFFLMSIFGQLITVQPSSLDLAVDVVGLDLGSIHDVKKHFVSRAQLTGELPGTIPASDGMIDGPEQIKERWGRLTGLPFGARAGALSALIYDKTHEIKYNSPEKGYMWDIWQYEAEKQGFCLLPSAKVWRIELRFKRPALNEMKQEDVFHGIDNAYTLEQHLPGLWSYAVGHVGGVVHRFPDGRVQRLPDGWLRYIMPTSDTNRSRWPVHPDWQVLQSAFQPAIVEESDYEREQREKTELLADLDEYLLEHPSAPDISLTPFESPAVEKMIPPVSNIPIAASLPAPLDFLPYVRKRKQDVNLRRLVAQIAGCTVTAEAWRHATTNEVEPDISDTFQYLYKAVDSYLIEQKKDFNKLVHKKRVYYHLEQQLADFDEAIA